MGPIFSRMYVVCRDALYKDGLTRSQIKDFLQAFEHWEDIVRPEIVVLECVQSQRV